MSSTVSTATFPERGVAVTVVVDWERRHRLMRTHSALHVLCGVIWNEWGFAVTGGNMAPLAARMDFEFDPLPDGFVERITELVDAEIAADRPISVSFLPRAEALGDADLIRTKVNLIPESVTRIRVVDIGGLDRQRRRHPCPRDRRDRDVPGDRHGVQGQGEQAGPHRVGLTQCSSRWFANRPLGGERASVRRLRRAKEPIAVVGDRRGRRPTAGPGHHRPGGDRSRWRRLRVGAVGPGAPRRVDPRRR